MCEAFFQALRSTDRQIPTADPGGGSPRQGCSPLLIVMIVTGWVGVLFLFFQISSNTKNKAPDGPFLVLFLLKSVGVNQSSQVSQFV